MTNIFISHFFYFNNKRSDVQLFSYRIRQFYWDLFSKMTDEDLKFAQEVLNLNELDLFKKLSISEQKHSVRVAYDVRRICQREKLESDELLKAALLHDIGKIFKRLNIIDKSLFVLFDKFSFGSVRKHFADDYRISKISVFYNHPSLGACILGKIGCSPRVIYLVKNHSNKNIEGDRQLDILQYCDNTN